MRTVRDDGFSEVNEASDIGIEVCLEELFGVVIQIRVDTKSSTAMEPMLGDSASASRTEIKIYGARF